MNLVLLQEDAAPARLAGVPAGAEALAAKALLPTLPARTLALVLRDDQALYRALAALAFFAPEIEALGLPAWDCLPYDRVSPHRDIVAWRIESLTRLQDLVPASGRIIVTTVNALVQRLPPREALWNDLLRLEKGQTLAPDALIERLRKSGYERVETASEPGEFAVRGGIVDLYPTGAEQPYRLDFFGDTLEALRLYDPLSQRSTGQAETLLLKPISEFRLDAASIERFRSGYRGLFGTQRDDPLYEAVSEGRHYDGVEHWLPLFHERMETLADYLPAGAPLLLDHEAAALRDQRLAQVEEFYAARIAAMKRREEGGAPYRPLPPSALYLSPAEWDGLAADRRAVELSPFHAPDQPDLGLRPARDFTAARLSAAGLYPALKQALGEAAAGGRRVLVAGLSEGTRDRLEHLLVEHGIGPLAKAATWEAAKALPDGTVGLVTLPMERGLEGPDFLLFTEQDLLGERLARAGARHRRAENFLTEVAALATGDLVVHVDHGIGRYDGLETLDVGGAPHDCLKVIYAGGDRLFIPVENIDVLSRYGSEDAAAELDKLGGAGWQSRKARAKERIREIAKKLIHVAAERELREVSPTTTPEGVYEEFAARFPYPETDDQLTAISDALGDLGSGKPMDRLICGDVGFGKTEVALRAAFVVAMSGRQVAVVVPTTLLARQHARTFAERFTGLPLRVAQLSRLVSAKEAVETKKALAEGKVDVVIGTHALLAKSIAFKRLGLLIVDEEQHFGVKQKERLKELSAEVHVLTLSATPIPRTLQLAMAGVREMSLIATPPVDRLAVRTFVLPYDPVIVREAVLRERMRGGQIFYVCPRVEDLPEVEERLARLVPEARIAVAHGQLPPTRLESVMSDFLDRRYDILLSTNIVESGLDIPSANTLVIHRADMFGLAQLYQLRGRIGRSKVRGYAYLTLPPGRLLTPAAKKRLEVMQTLDTLGAGFMVASHDMDIRGAGNLLGEEQSGHVREVGIELYQQMLEEALAALKQKRGAEQALPRESWTPQINMGVPVLIPESYVADLDVRLGLYRRLANLVQGAEIEGFAAELIDRFGPLPPEVENLLDTMAIKQLCRAAAVEKIDAGPKGGVIAFRDNRPADPDRLIAMIRRNSGEVRLRPDQRVVVQADWRRLDRRIGGVKEMLQKLAPAA